MKLTTSRSCLVTKLYHASYKIIKLQYLHMELFYRHLSHMYRISSHDTPLITLAMVNDQTLIDHSRAIENQDKNLL